eukprot:TRINITY_DN9711_c0_g2_i2.p1 TRINITY_DN9711_c0_g2~~TRINITY_DN9711_c0_g2_i2.p1  ORF type:complete len:206 (+),score=51.52 TRINITY_DN9711_c0_g2_i2:36-620(+)
MFSWLTGGGAPDVPKVKVYDRTRFLLDAFYTLYCPEEAHEIDELCHAVQSKVYSLDEVATKLCERFAKKGAVGKEWVGEQPSALLKYRFDRFYLTYDPSSLDKCPDLVEHVRSGRYPLTVVLNKMCTKYAAQGATMANWIDEYPKAMRTERTNEPIEVLEQKVGDKVNAIINGKLVEGTVTAGDKGTFTVTFRR